VLVNFSLFASLLVFILLGVRITVEGGQFYDPLHVTRLLERSRWRLIWKHPYQPGWTRSLGNVVSATFIYTPPATLPSVPHRLSSTTLPYAPGRPVPLRQPLRFWILLAVPRLSASAQSQIYSPTQLELLFILLRTCSVVYRRHCPPPACGVHCSS
jgi:hypothetical protein